MNDGRGCLCCTEEESYGVRFILENVAPFAIIAAAGEAVFRLARRIGRMF